MKFFEVPIRVTPDFFKVPIRVTPGFFKVSVRVTPRFFEVRSKGNHSYPSRGSKEVEALVCLRRGAKQSDRPSGAAVPTTLARLLEARGCARGKLGAKCQKSRRLK
ncbi:hypothetical protein KM043_001145 [Ampulex compressa]|nr:hypothetical protein KM043_001145 [Ampulex compressa]